ncbi:MAG TPA: 4-hydroxyproline epimerase [Rubricoccaceae bacterium]|nr:4-hydroxyproline epimerase [Rubricoccaceae bacterium]
MSAPPEKIRVIDSHTGGEPTRVVVDGGPDLGGGPLAARLVRFRDRFDRYRSAVVNEPRGSDVVVGALLVEPEDAGCAAGVIFFNNVGYLGMCGHGTIGVVATLAHLGWIGPGEHRFETPVGEITATLHADGSVSVANVPSYRHRAGVTVEVPGVGPVVGDVAWGGNWFFLAPAPADVPLDVAHAEALTAYAGAVRHALAAAGVTGAGGAEIDHVELVGPTPTADARNFVLCPGGAYDRSPCGTGTSAKIACLVGDGRLAPGAVWRQESVVGSVFEASAAVRDGVVFPTIRGRAFVTGEATLVLDPADPFRWGIRPEAVDTTAA